MVLREEASRILDRVDVMVRGVMIVDCVDGE